MSNSFENILPNKIITKKKIIYPQSIFELPEKPDSYSRYSNCYYPDQLYITDNDNIKKNNVIVSSIKKNTFTPAELNYSKYKNDYYAVVKCKECEEYFTRLESLQNTLSYNYCVKCQENILLENQNKEYESITCCNIS